MIAAFGGTGTPVFTGEELPPSAAEKTPCPRRGGLPGSPGGDAVPTAEGKRGQDTKYGFLSPLDSPYLPSDATPFGCASKSEGPTDAFGAPRLHS